MSLDKILKQLDVRDYEKGNDYWIVPYSEALEAELETQGIDGLFVTTFENEKWIFMPAGTSLEKDLYTDLLEEGLEFLDYLNSREYERNVPEL